METKYDFNKLIERNHTNSYKWDSNENTDVIPLWVADMDFKTAPSIIEALKKRVEHGIFGYTRVPEEYYNSVINWFEKEHGWLIERKSFIYTSGVVPAISAIIKALTKPGDGVLVQTPVYNCFFSSIRNNECRVIENPLIYKENTYFINYEDLEDKLSLPETRIMLLCNPHNPAGRVWSRDELNRIGELCQKHNVIVVSDEIHCELVYKPYKYTPYSIIGRDYSTPFVVCISPSKAFNIAGLQIANIICDFDDLRKRIDKAININEVCDVNPFGVIATIAAYNEGKEWLEALKDYLWKNYQFTKQFFEENLPTYPVTKLEGTYLVWVDCRHLNVSSEELETRLLEKGNVWINGGNMYGAAGNGFIRINIACPKQRLQEGLTRLAKVLKNW